jgi:hypothetical protein
MRVVWPVKSKSQLTRAREEFQGKNGVPRRRMRERKEFGTTKSRYFED